MMDEGAAGQVTRLLTDPSLAARDRAEQLLQLVYQQLRASAQEMMNAERADHTLQATALVHEAYLRLVGDRDVPWRNRAHFFAAAAEAMRRILLDHARRRSTEKRGGGLVRRPLNVIDLADGGNPEEILALDEAFSRLESESPETAAVVRLRLYAGLSVDDAAAALGIGPRQVDRLWAFARAWLYRELDGCGGSGGSGGAA